MIAKAGSIAQNPRFSISPNGKTQYEPTPNDIRRECLAINSTWSPRERAKRAGIFQGISPSVQPQTQHVSQSLLDTVRDIDQADDFDLFGDVRD